MLKNELSTQTSPYLLQHAHNPVHWQVWGNGALLLAKKLDKPILVSIGYSACHWCHVMERESFENEATAAIMNAHFINIKIDREERPDLDHIYMDAVQAISGSGGWPLNVFLTPEGKPFYGGTYFPPVKAHGRASWQEVLNSVHTAWISKREDMETQAETLLQHLKKANHFGRIVQKLNIAEGEMLFSKNDGLAIINNLLSNADIEEGGFGNAPKFPQTFNINCLLQGYYFFKNDAALTQAELSLTKMIQGGIYDQLGGGLCRYSTDAQWLAPHFEKMLYDNALFVTALSNAYLLTKKDIYKNTITHTLQFLLAKMKHAAGGYYAAIDADSEGIEGKYYVWDKTEIDTILGEDAALFCTYYNVSTEGNWEHVNILHITQPINTVAKLFGLTNDLVEVKLNTAVQKLLAVRAQKVAPTIDDKILLGWNCLLITAYCKAYAALQKETYKEEAESLFLFIENKFVDKNGAYYHTYKNSVALYPAFLDDYAYFIEACLHLQEITGNEIYVIKAKNLLKFVIINFADSNSPFFFYTHQQQSDVVLRKIELYDGATPSANSVMASNLFYLSIIFDEPQWKNRALSMIDSLKTIILKHPNSFGIWAGTSLNILAGINEIVITGINKTPQLQKVLHQFIPNKIVQSTHVSSNLPMLINKQILDTSTIYLCHNYQCNAPCSTVDELLLNLKI